MVLSGNILYGTANAGGKSGNGTVFKINTDGMDFTNLHSFTATTAGTNSDGANPQNSLVLLGNTLYGTTPSGGSSGNGTVFAVNTDGTGFTNLHTFTATTLGTNSDGAWPYARLILSGNTLYGTANQGGSSGNGTVFKVNTDGSGFTNLYTFTATVAGTNTDGAFPYGGVILSGNTLYGTANGGGSSSDGTVFAINTNGTSFTNLYTFSAISGSNNTNSDGADPIAPLILSGSTLYGLAPYGGNSGNGTVFAINTNGSSFMTLYNFSAFGLNSYTNSDGAWPNVGLIISNNTLYGTAWVGGYSGNGTLFSLNLPVPPSIGIATAGNKIILFWPTNAANFTLQSITNLPSGSWSNVTIGINTVGTNYMFTNTVNSKNAFFRLQQQ